MIPVSPSSLRSPSIDHTAYIRYSRILQWLSFVGHIHPTTVFLFFIGVMDYVSAEISTSKEKKFSLVTFVDTPGLVDGDMIYPFDVNSAITWLGKYLRIYVFSITRVAPQILMHLMLLRRRTGGPDFRLLWPDGSGAVQTDAQHRGEAERQMWRQAVVLSQQSRRSWEGDGQTGQFFIHKSCFNFYPEKALAYKYMFFPQRVMMQIVQELCRRPGLNKCGFEMPTIYIPNPQKVKFSVPVWI